MGLIAVPVVLDVHPGGYADAARTLGDEIAESVRLVWADLEVALDGAWGMAGSAENGTAWGRSYDGVAAAAAAVIGDAVNGCYRLAALLEQTGHNYGDADAASVPGEPSGVSANRWAGSSVELFDPPTAVGFGVPAPAGWHPLQHAIGLLWPDGHQDRLHAAADAWIRAGNQLVMLLAEVDAAISALIGQRAPEVDDAVTVVAGLGARLGELAGLYGRIGQACTGYAHELDQAHHAIIDEIRNFVEITVAIEAAGGLLAVGDAGHFRGPRPMR